MQKLNRIASGVALLGLALSAPAFAQTSVPWQGDFWGYIGASAGQSKFRSDCARVDVFACDKRDTAWRVYSGGRVDRYFGLEAAYTDFGKVAASGGQTKAWAAGLSLTAGVPIANRFDVFGKLGGVYGRTDISASPSTLFDTGHKNGWGWTYGAGASFDITKTVAIRADWDRYKLDFVGGRRDLDMASAGVQVRF